MYLSVVNRSGAATRTSRARRNAAAATRPNYRKLHFHSPPPARRLLRENSLVKRAKYLPRLTLLIKHQHFLFPSKLSQFTGDAL